MPGATMKSIKKGVSRVAAARKDANAKMVRAAVEGELEGCVFGRVVKHLGGGNIEVLDADKCQAIGAIRGLLRKRGVTPIAAGNIVLMSPREFESVKPGKKRTYDIVGVLDGAAAAALEKEGAIPTWMVGAGAVEGSAGAAADGFEFDYAGAAAGDEEVDVDAI